MTFKMSLFCCLLSILIQTHPTSSYAEGSATDSAAMDDDATLQMPDANPLFKKIGKRGKEEFKAADMHRRFEILIVSVSARVHDDIKAAYEEMMYDKFEVMNALGARVYRIRGTKEQILRLLALNSVPSIVIAKPLD